MNSKFCSIFTLPEGDENFELDTIFLHTNKDKSVNFCPKFFKKNTLSITKSDVKDANKNSMNPISNNKDEFRFPQNKYDLFSQVNNNESNVNNVKNNSFFSSPNIISGSLQNITNDLKSTNILKKFHSPISESKLSYDSQSFLNSSSSNNYSFNFQSSPQNTSAITTSKSFLRTDCCFSDFDSFSINFMNENTICNKNDSIHLKNQNAKKRKLPGPVGSLHLKNINMPNDDFLTDSNKEKVLILSQIENDKIKETLASIENKLDLKIRQILMDTPIISINQKAKEKVLLNCKVKLILGYVENVELHGLEATISLKDKTGSINGTLHRDLVDLLIPRLHVGDIILFKQVSVLCPTFGRNCYLNLTTKNIVRIYQKSYDNFVETEFNGLNDVLENNASSIHVGLSGDLNNQNGGQFISNNIPDNIYCFHSKVGVPQGESSKNLNRSSCLVDEGVSTSNDKTFAPPLFKITKNTVAKLSYVDPASKVYTDNSFNQGIGDPLGSPNNNDNIKPNNNMILPNNRIVKESNLLNRIINKENMRFEESSSGVPTNHTSSFNNFGSSTNQIYNYKLEHNAGIRNSNVYSDIAIHPVMGTSSKTTMPFEFKKSNSSEVKVYPTVIGYNTIYQDNFVMYEKNKKKLVEDVKDFDVLLDGLDTEFFNDF